MKNNFRKMLAITAAVMLTASGASCSGKGKSSPPSASTVEISQTMYKEERVKLPSDFSAVIDSRYIEETGKICLIYAAKDGSLKLAWLNESLEAEESITLIKSESLYQHAASIESDGSITLALMLVEPSETEITDYVEYYASAEKTVEIRRHNAAGELYETVTVNGLEEYYNTDSSHFEFILPYGSGWLLTFFDGWALIGKDGTLSDVKTDAENIYLGTDSNGRAIAATFDDYCYLDGSTLKLPEEKTAFGDYLRRSRAPMAGAGDFTALFPLNDGVFGLTESGELVQIVSYKASNILSSEIYNISYAGEGKFMLIGCNKNGYYMSKLTVRPDDYVENKKTVTVATEWAIDDGDSDLAVMFNKFSDDYEVQMKAYPNGIEELTADILSDEAPDVIQYSFSGDMYNLTNMGALVNMYDLMEEYGGFRKEDILDNVIEAFEYKDGLYGISDSFYLPIYFANREVIGREYGTWSFDDFYSFAENMPENMYLGNQMTFNNSAAVFDYLCTLNTSAWIDYDNATCNFDSEEFIKLLEFCRDAKTLPERDWQEHYASLTEAEQAMDTLENALMLKNKTALLVNSHSAAMLDDIMLKSADLGLPVEELTFVNAPSDNGKGVIACSGKHLYSVIASGDCTEGGWEFMNYIMGYQHQSTSIGFATRKDAFDYILENEQELLKNTYTTIGNDTSSQRQVCLEISDEALQYIRDYISTSTLLYSNSNAIYEILTEEFGYFINGETTAPQCAEMIQNRISIYLSEHA